MSIRHVLLATNELSTVTAVTAALQSNGALAAEDICRDLSELTWRLERGPSPAVLVDIDPEPNRMLARLEPLARRFSESRFIVLSAEMHQELLLGAMQAGARHFLLKQSIGSDLNRVLKQLCPDGHGSPGQAITVLGAGGGCGATTLAVNLAAELQLRSKEEGDDQPALVMDLDSHYGGVAAYLGVEGEYGLLDVLERSGAIDAQLIQSSSLSHSDSLHALISARRERLGEPISVDPQRLGHAIDACKAGYRWTVIDAPRISPAAAAALARHSAVTLLLLQLTVKDLRAARQMLASLHEQGVSQQSIRVVATRYRKRRQLIEPEEAKKVLGLSEDQSLELLPNDYYAVAEAVNLGKVLAQTSPRSDFRRELQKLAATIPAAAQQRLAAVGSH